MTDDSPLIAELTCEHGILLPAWCKSCEIEMDQMSPLFREKT